MITVLWVFEVKAGITQNVLVNVQFYTWLCLHKCFIIIIIIIMALQYRKYE